MNRELDKLHPYPFERFRKLLEKVEPGVNLPLIAWSLGEPKHSAPGFIVDGMREEDLIRQDLGGYPPTRGLPELRRAISEFLQDRFRLSRAPDPDSQVLPVNGTREALFAFAQTVLDAKTGGVTIMPNPFYQIYEGAALLAGSEPHYLNCIAENDYLPDFDSVDSNTWQRCQLVYICTPGNPTGAVMSEAQLQQLIRLADEHDFIIASDECYSEIYLDESRPPPGLLQAAGAMGRHDYRRCITFNSLSKRSNLPGMRSGYVAGDALIIEKFLLYRTYHGSAMPLHHQRLSTLAWRDEQHVVDNRALYRTKFATVAEILGDTWPMEMPTAGFYLWPQTPAPDESFAVELVRHANVSVLPGSYLSRETATGNPGKNRVRIALVATEEECAEAATRIVNCWERLL